MDETGKGEKRLTVVAFCETSKELNEVTTISFIINITVDIIKMAIIATVNIISSKLFPSAAAVFAVTIDL